MTTAPSVSPLLAVFAHPDDESLAAGGLLALAADAGARVSVLCLTRGEAANPGADDSGRRALAARRTEELERATRILGVSDVEILDHPDGMLPWVDADAVESDLRRAIARVSPSAIVTFDADGLYWHPDHIAVHERTMAVVAAMGADAPVVYVVTSPPGQMRALADAATTRGGPSWVIRGLDDPDAFGADAATPTLVVDVGRVASRKLAAIVCHRSQTEGGALDVVPAADAARLLGVEHYRRVDIGGQGQTFIERFASVPASRLSTAE